MELETFDVDTTPYGVGCCHYPGDTYCYANDAKEAIANLESKVDALLSIETGPTPRRDFWDALERLRELRTPAMGRTTPNRETEEAG